MRRIGGDQSIGSIFGKKSLCLSFSRSSQRPSEGWEIDNVGLLVKNAQC